MARAGYRIFDADTSSIAFVILAVFWTERIRRRISRNVAIACCYAPNVCLKERIAASSFCSISGEISFVSRIDLAISG